MGNETNFRQYMDTPHRRPAYGVNSPAAFRHIVFRIQDAPAAADFEQTVLARNTFIGQLNARLKDIQKRFCAERNYQFNPIQFSPASAPNPASDDNNSYVDISRTLVTEFHPEIASEQNLGWRTRMLVDFHSEFYSLTFIRDQPNDPAQLDAETMAAQALDYEGQLSGRPPMQNKTPQPVQSAEARSAALIKFFYEDVWTDIEPCLRELGQASPPTLAQAYNMPGACFTEFRAVALRDLESKFAQLNAKNKAQPRKIVLIGDPRTDEDFSATRKGLRAWIMKNEDTIRDILKLNQLRRLDRDANCVLCEVLDGGAIYGSTLGQVPVVPTAEGQIPVVIPQTTPLRYFIVHNDLSKYQLGRLIRRHHILGELRMAALFDLTMVLNAGARIQSLGSELDHKLEKRRINRQSETDTTIDPNSLSATQNTLNEIHSSVIPSGLTYRVARSRYYADSFEKRVKEMRIHRLEGWEPYDTFISRNLTQVFFYISAVGTRYQALADRVARLAAAHNVERMTKITFEIWKFQKLGEAIGIGAFAYYVGHIISVFIKAIMKTECLRRHPPGAEECEELIKQQSEYIEIFGIIVALFIAVRYLSRLWDWWTTETNNTKK
jgi:hypothetical protein